MEISQKRPTGMVAFTTVWIGQVVSLLGTAMSAFALTLWAYDVTGKATPLALVGFLFVTPQVMLSPIVGVLVDHSNRKLMMMLSDLAAALTTVIILTLYATGNLQIWHLYITATISGILQRFQWPAYSTAITLMLSKEQYGRANGMLELAGNASRVFAPLLAGALLGSLGLTGYWPSTWSPPRLRSVHCSSSTSPATQDQSGSRGGGELSAGSNLRLPLYLRPAQPARPADSLLGWKLVF